MEFLVFTFECIALIFIVSVFVDAIASVLYEYTSFGNIKLKMIAEQIASISGIAVVLIALVIVFCLIVKHLSVWNKPSINYNQCAYVGFATNTRKCSKCCSPCRMVYFSEQAARRHSLIRTNSRKKECLTGCQIWYFLSATENTIHYASKWRLERTSNEKSRSCGKFKLNVTETSMLCAGHSMSFRT